nr:TetR/AcrR family transcriptional regulator [Streptomyces sp. CBMA152]
MADAAIATLAREGMRGLTHRAVDRFAGLPEGTTSYYFRTRQALLQAAVERLAELTAAELQLAPIADPDDLADAAAAVVESWLTSGRDRQLARFELSMEATRRPELREVLRASGASVRAEVAGLLARVGVPDPARRAAVLVACVDGLVFDRLVGAGSADDDPAVLRTVIRTLLA